MKNLIHKILCKLGIHKYRMKQKKLLTVVKCEWCGCDLLDETNKEWEKKRKKILSKPLP